MPGYVEEPETITLNHPYAGGRSSSRGRRSTSRQGRDVRVSASIPEEDEDADDVQIEPEEAETLRRADECYHLWRMFENRRHPTPPPKGRGKARANTGRRNPDIPRLKATTATAEADPKFHECLARGGSRFEAFKRHKSRLKTAAFQDFYGLEPTSPKSREASVMSRIRSLANCGLVPTNDELANAVSMEHFKGCYRPRRRRLRGRSRRGGP